jgi:integrase
LGHAYEDQVKTNLTELVVKQLKPKAKRYDVLDTQIPHFGIRVNINGSKTWFFRNRERGRFSLGEYPATGLAEAREKARAWSNAKEKGIVLADAEREVERKRQAARGELFENVARRYLDEYVSQTRTAQRSRREIESYIVPEFGEMRLNDIVPKDISDFLRRVAAKGIAGVKGNKGKGNPAPYQARTMLTHLKTLYKWAISNGIGNAKESPARDIEPRHVIGRNVIKPRERTLSNAELVALWAATDKVGYPWGSLYRLLLLTGARLTDIKDARWEEIDFDTGTLTVPGSRFKTGVEHTIQLSAWAQRIIEALPRVHDDFLFSSGRGYGLLNSQSAGKKLIDGALQEITGTPYVEHKKGSKLHWQAHDLRRTLRTKLTELGVSTDVAEMIMGHSKRGLLKTYDHYKYGREVRAALDKFAKHLETLGCKPPPKGGKVVTLVKRRKVA